MLEDLRPLALFAKVIELGSFRAAARAYGLSASVVSHHVSELESRFGVPLLYRSTRRLALTPDGESLLLPARAMMEAAQRGVDALSGRSATPDGLLRVTAPAFFAETPFPQGLAAFLNSYPRAQLTVSFSDGPRDLLRDGLDLALRIGKLEDSAYKVRKLAEMQRLLVASPAYVESRRSARQPRELAEWDFVKLTSRPAELRLRAPNRRGVATVQFVSRVSVDSASAMRALVVEGAGIAALPEVMVRRELERGALIEVLPRWRLVSLGVYAVRPMGTAASRLTQLFVDFMEPRLVAFLSQS